MYPRMKILLVHNRYKQTGGEDTVLENERRLLQGAGHQVTTYLRSNDELDSTGRWAAATSTIWSRRTYREIGALIDQSRPDIVHCHNTFPLVSPAVYFAANSRRVAVIQTLHNFRLTCLNALLFRQGKPCTDCVGTLPWRGVIRRCYQDAAPQSAVSAALVIAHRALRTYKTRVDAYIALTETAKTVFVRAGIPAARIHVKPNFVEAPTSTPPPADRSGVLFVGRLSREKGVETLARIAGRLSHIQFRVIGDGPEAPLLQGLPNVQLLGSLPRENVFAAMREASCLVMPSVSFEGGFPMVISEAFANGLPVIASGIGAMAEIIEDGRTGLLCTPGGESDFSAAILRLVSEPVLSQMMSIAAQGFFQARLSAARNLQELESIYRNCLGEAASQGHRDPVQ
jgi:glycosyltransferase involved in cell wall biosynthesis